MREIERLETALAEASLGADGGGAAGARDDDDDDDDDGGDARRALEARVATLEAALESERRESDRRASEVARDARDGVDLRVSALEELLSVERRDARAAADAAAAALDEERAAGLARTEEALAAERLANDNDLARHRARFEAKLAAQLSGLEKREEELAAAKLQAQKANRVVADAPGGAPRATTANAAFDHKVAKAINAASRAVGHAERRAKLAERRAADVDAVIAAHKAEADELRRRLEEEISNVPAAPPTAPQSPQPKDEDLMNQLIAAKLELADANCQVDDLRLKLRQNGLS